LFVKEPAGDPFCGTASLTYTEIRFESEIQFAEFVASREPVGPGCDTDARRRGVGGGSRKVLEDLGEGLPD
jgi:hypothetical protein